MAAAPSSSAIIDLGDDELQFTESTPPGGGGGGGGTTHTFGAPHSAVDDDGGDDDREQLLGEGRKGAGGGGGGNFLSVDFYRRFFDVDTDEVGARILGAVVPVRGRSFLQDVTKRRPDLYGPFWICTTLVVSVAVTGNMVREKGGRGVRILGKLEISYHCTCTSPSCRRPTCSRPG